MVIPIQQAYNTKVVKSILYSKARVVNQQGGTWSGKTYGALLALLEIAKRDTGSLITIAGQDLPNLKRGAIRDINRIFSDYPILRNRVANVNNSEHSIKFKNGSIMEFAAYDNAQDAKNGKRDYLFCNEVNGIPKPIYEELSIRTTKKIICDYNPNRKFWLHDLQGSADVEFYISTYKDNPACPIEIQEAIEALKETDPQRYIVYGLGLTGVTDAIVFNRGFAIVDEIPQDAKFVAGGIDFGYNDPCAIVETYEYNGEWYIDEILYQTRLSNADIARALNKSKLYYADSAEPKSIEELQTAGCNVLGAIKGKDSIKYGIDKIKSKKINLTRRSVNIAREMQAYSYLANRDGIVTENFEDRNNHSIDSIRYSLSGKEVNLEIFFI